MQEHATTSPSPLHRHHAAHQVHHRGTVANTVKDDHFEAVPVKNINIGEFVRKISKDGSMQAKTFRRGEYDRASKSYALTDCDDVNRQVFVRGTVKLAVAFTY